LSSAAQASAFVTLPLSSARRKRAYAEPCEVTNGCSHRGPDAGECLLCRFVSDGPQYPFSSAFGYVGDSTAIGAAIGGLIGLIRDEARVDRYILYGVLSGFWWGLCVVLISPLFT
jgi:hypothetical protein